MKETQSKSGFKDNHALPVFILVVAIILVVPVFTPSFTASADDTDDKAELPEWYEGDVWEYEMREEIAHNLTYLTDVKKEVVDERGEVNIKENGDEGETYETYVVSETHVRSYEEKDERIGNIEGEFHYTKEHLSPVYTNPEEAIASFYYPPIEELNFPLSVGKNWSGGGDKDIYFFEDNTTEENDEPLEPSKEVHEFYGEVEEKVTKEVKAGTFDTFLVNLTVLGEDLEKEENPLELKRFEIYYSPEVKNIIHRNIYETRRVPDDYGGPGGGSGESMVWEEETGTESLVRYDLEPESAHPNDNNGDSPFLSTGTMVLAIMGTALFYRYKKDEGENE